jgi:hypothetical protein
MKNWLSLIVLFLLVGAPARAEDAVTRISYFADPYGNNGSFWRVTYQARPYHVFKVKSPDKTGEADFLFDDATLTEFENKVSELRRTPNPLKADGFQVLWSVTSGDATVKTLHGRLNGVKVKMIQVVQRKPNEPEREHQICMDECYPAFTSALQKLKRAKASDSGPK